MTHTSDATAHNPTPGVRPKPGQRRLDILQAFAAMLEQPTAERVTTAALAKRLGVSEAALYRHFASKAQMLDELISFIDDSLMGLAAQVGAQVAEHNLGGRVACAQLTQLILQFAQTNPGMVRVLVGDALLLEHPRLAERVGLIYDKLEANLRSHWRLTAGEAGVDAPSAQAALRAQVLMSFVRGQLLRFSRSQWRAVPTDRLEQQLQVLLG